MQRININKTKNPVFRKYFEEGERQGIAKSSQKIVASINAFAQMEGIGKKTLDKLYEAFDLNKDISDEEQAELDKKWGKYNE